jgi:hypothetical protein
MVKKVDIGFKTAARKHVVPKISNACCGPTWVKTAGVQAIVDQFAWHLLALKASFGQQPLKMCPQGSP